MSHALPPKPSPSFQLPNPFQQQQQAQQIFQPPQYPPFPYQQPFPLYPPPPPNLFSSSPYASPYPEGGQSNSNSASTSSIQSPTQNSQHQQQQERQLREDLKQRLAAAKMEQSRAASTPPTTFQHGNLTGLTAPSMVISLSDASNSSFESDDSSRLVKDSLVTDSPSRTTSTVGPSPDDPTSGLLTFSTSSPPRSPPHFSSFPHPPLLGTPGSSSGSGSGGPPPLPLSSAANQTRSKTSENVKLVIQQIVTAGIETAKLGNLLALLTSVLEDTLKVEFLEKEKEVSSRSEQDTASSKMDIVTENGREGSTASALATLIEKEKVKDSVIDQVLLAVQSLERELVIRLPRPKAPLPIPPPLPSANGPPPPVPAVNLPPIVVPSPVSILPKIEPASPIQVEKPLPPPQASSAPAPPPPPAQSQNLLDRISSGPVDSLPSASTSSTGPLPASTRDDRPSSSGPAPTSGVDSRRSAGQRSPEKDREPRDIKERERDREKHARERENDRERDRERDRRERDRKRPLTPPGGYFHRAPSHHDHHGPPLPLSNGYQGGRGRSLSPPRSSMGRSHPPSGAPAYRPPYPPVDSRDFQPHDSHRHHDSHHHHLPPFLSNGPPPPPPPGFHLPPPGFLPPPVGRGPSNDGYDPRGDPRGPPRDVDPRGPPRDMDPRGPPRDIDPRDLRDSRGPPRGPPPPRGALDGNWRDERERGGNGFDRRGGRRRTRSPSPRR